VPLGLSYQRELACIVVPTTRGMADSTLSNAPGETIFVIALDQLWQHISQGNPIIHGVKLDVQGMELDALRGMTDTLRRFKPMLVIEVHRGVNRDILLKLVAEMGYEARPLSIESGYAKEELHLLDDTSYLFMPLARSDD
jgi:hypothetical protein